MAIVGGTWTYTGNPASSNLDAVRYLVADTNNQSQMVSDEEINWTLSDTGNDVYLAAAETIDALLGNGNYSSKSVGDFSISGGETAGQLATKSKQYRRRALRGGSPFAGGISVTDNDARDDDTDIPSKAFRLGRNDYPGSAQDGNGDNDADNEPWLSR